MLVLLAFSNLQMQALPLSLHYPFHTVW